MVRPISCLALLVGSLLACLPASAQVIVTHTFEGVASLATLPGSAVGQPCTAVMSYDATQAPVQELFGQKDFGTYSFTLDHQALTFVEDPGSVLTVIDLFGDAISTIGTGSGFAAMDLNDGSGTVFSSPDLPLTLQIADFDTGLLLVGGGGLTCNITSVSSQVSVPPGAGLAVTHEFEGLATTATAPGSALGQPCTATMSYDATQAPVLEFPEQKNYADYSFTLNHEALTFVEDPGSTLIVTDLLSDALLTWATGAGFAGMQLSDSSGTVFSTPDLPLTLRIVDFDTNFLQVVGGGLTCSVTSVSSQVEYIPPPQIPAMGSVGRVVLATLLAIACAPRLRREQRVRT